MSVMSDFLRLHGPQPDMLLCPWDSPGKNAGMGCHALLHALGLPDPGIETAAPVAPACRWGLNCRAIGKPMK